MQRLNTVLTQLCIEARANQTEADADAKQHSERVQHLIDRAASAQLTPAPPHLHNAGNITLREVTAADINSLRIGRSIALATRALLKKGAGNQRLAIAASGGDSQMATRGMRKIRVGDTLDTDANPGEAALAILAGAGLCGEHARVASALARQQNIAVVRVGVEEEDHGAALLLPQRGSKAVVVDAWTTIPTSCLKADSLFADVEFAEVSTSVPASTSTSTLTSESKQESPISRTFNLVTLDTLRERLSQQLGPDPIKQAMQDDFVAKRNGAYGGGPKPRWVSTLPDAIYHEAANYLSDEARRHVTLHIIDADGVVHLTAQPSVLIDAASFTDLRATAIVNSKPLHNWMHYQVHKQAVQPPQHPVTLHRVHTDWLTTSSGLRVCVSVDLEISRRPFLRDMRLPSKNILYRSTSGETFSTIDTEQSVIDTGLLGLECAQQAGFPERFVAAVQPSPASTAALAQYALKRLQTRESPAPPCSFNAATHTDLQLLDEALAHSPQVAFDIVMQRFSALLPELHSTQIAEGVQVWNAHWRRLSEGAPLMTAAAQVMDGWARHFDDAVVEPHLRDALLLTHDPARLIGALTRHVLMLPSMQQRALNAIDVALADMPAGEARDGLVTMVREAVVRIADTGTRTAALAMVARHG